VILKRESLGLQEAEFKNLSQILQKRFKEKGYGKKSWIVSERSVTGGVEKDSVKNFVSEHMLLFLPLSHTSYSSC
jgi:hypothetical protein